MTLTKTCSTMTTVLKQIQCTTQNYKQTYYSDKENLL